MCCTSLATSCASSCLWVMLLKTTWHFFVAFSTASGNLPQHLTWLPKGSNLRSVHMLHSHKMSTKSCYVPCRYRTVPYRTVPYRTVPYRTVPYRTVPYRTVPYRTVPYRTALDYTTPHHTTPYHTIPHHTTPHHTTPHRTAPHHTTTCIYVYFRPMIDLSEVTPDPPSVGKTISF